MTSSFSEVSGKGKFALIRNLWLSAFLAALILHITGFAVMQFWRLLLALGLITMQVPVTVKPPRLRLKKEKIQFLTIEDAKQEDVKKAAYEARAARKARDEYLKKMPDKHNPNSIGKSPVPAVNPGNDLKNQVASTVALAKVPATNTALDPKPKTQLSKAPKPEVTQKKSKLIEKPHDPPQAKLQVMEKIPTKAIVVENNTPEPERKLAQTKPQPEQMKIETKTIGARARRAGGKPEKRKKSSAALRGDKTFRTMQARYPEYMERVIKTIEEELYVQYTMGVRSYRTGVIALKFGIAPDGKLSKLKIVYAKKNMLTEQNICLTAMEKAAPFEPFSAVMLKDKKFFNDLGLGVYFGY